MTSFWYAERLGIEQQFSLDSRRQVSSKRASNPATRQKRTINYNENAQTSIFTNLHDLKLEYTVNNFKGIINLKVTLQQLQIVQMEDA